MTPHRHPHEPIDRKERGNGALVLIVMRSPTCGTRTTLDIQPQLGEGRADVIEKVLATVIWVSYTLSCVSSSAPIRGLVRHETLQQGPVVVVRSKSLWSRCAPLWWPLLLDDDWHWIGLLHSLQCSLLWYAFTDADGLPTPVEQGHTSVAGRSLFALAISDHHRCGAVHPDEGKVVSIRKTQKVELWVRGINDVYTHFVDEVHGLQSRERTRIGHLLRELVGRHIHIKTLLLQLLGHAKSTQCLHHVGLPVVPSHLFRDGFVFGTVVILSILRLPFHYQDLLMIQNIGVHPDLDDANRSHENIVASLQRCRLLLVYLGVELREGIRRPLGHVDARALQQLHELILFAHRPDCGPPPSVLDVRFDGFEIGALRQSDASQTDSELVLHVYHHVVGFVNAHNARNAAGHQALLLGHITRMVDMQVLPLGLHREVEFVPEAILHRLHPTI
mmetsp:Transcript_34249/g.91432  ORF Transcript_34249/g.91432 Transcript_34249/m.91432 type:complete len:446 (-) Transcript_34249:1105-2442(-)